MTFDLWTPEHPFFFFSTKHLGPLGLFCWLLAEMKCVRLGVLGRDSLLLPPAQPLNGSATIQMWFKRPWAITPESQGLFYSPPTAQDHDKPSCPEQIDGGLSCEGTWDSGAFLGGWAVLLFIYFLGQECP